ncbi:aspartyl/asparaginyl beta-hydroxylase domain-containing protein [Sphingomonas sp. ZB1N12]|uniref:aspartyl/asparaginyl beta-hydroxylase domain-containing protein n=1 Tax=Sphingomonas arabinosi TaxID=3096160 RepID=UPI002FC9DFA1
MQLTRPQAESLARDGMAALRNGNAARAYDTLSLLRDGAPGMPAPWFLIAQAAQSLGRDDEAETALVQFLAAEPRHLAALLTMAALKVRRGDDRAAQSFYRTALNVAALPNATIAPPLVPMLRAGEAFLTDCANRFAEHLGDALAGTRLATGTSGGRIGYALDLLLGRSELYLQQPSMFYFPGLAQRAFFERDEFAWVAAIEAQTAEMRAELESVVAAEKGFAPYVQSTPDRPAPANPLLDDPSWSAFQLWRGGERVEPNASSCPHTMAALDHAPIPVIAGRSPMAIFSLLKPGTHILPHHGMLNTRLICHLPLIAPEGCGLRVGAETRAWQTGEMLIFDDSFEHEAWNRGTDSRIVLLFEVWRPELTADERAALTDIFEAIDTYQGAAVDAG